MAVLTFPLYSWGYFGLLFLMLPFTSCHGLLSLKKIGKIWGKSEKSPGENLKIVKENGESRDQVVIWVNVSGNATNDLKFWCFG